MWPRLLAAFLATGFGQEALAASSTELTVDDQATETTAPTPRQDPVPIYALGFGFAVGGQHHPMARVPMVDLLVFEFRWFLNANTSLDFQIDWVQFWLSRAATSEPRLGLSAHYNLRRQAGKRFRWTVAPGVDLDIGADALVIEDSLAWRPRASPALSLKTGLEIRTLKRKRMDYGLVLHTAIGREHRRLLIETKFTWNGLLR